ncbi:MAG: hypothetical protein HYY45_17790 [Deltaproteobacteria bacterium]|nr:hypothetical protein [Deltaproteobacteria bacterium]
MSARVDQIVQVLEEMWRRQALLGAFRERTVKLIARRLGVHPNTVHDKLVRQLGPQVKEARDFDRLVARWLGGDAQPLRSALLEHAVSEDDRERIRRFFQDHDTAA